MTRLSSRLLVGVGFGIISLLVVILFAVPSAGQYEISIYRAFPWYFWALLVGSIVVGQTLILRGALGDGESGPYWQLGVLMTLLGNAMVVFMPYIRGYPYYERADVLTHLGYIQVIEATGVVGTENIYPNIHQLVLALSYATGLEPMRVINAVSAVISLFSILAAVALVAAVYDRRRALFTVPFVCLLVGGTAHMNASPYAQSVLLLPFVLYLFVREQQTHAVSVRFALAVSLVALVIYHPLTALFALLFFAIYAVSHLSVVRGVLFASDESPPNLTGAGTATRLLLGVFVAWYYNFAGILIRANSILNRLLGTTDGDSRLEAYRSTVSRTSPALVDILGIAVLKYGLSAILFGLAGLHFATLLVRRARNRVAMGAFELSFLMTAMTFVGLSVVFLVFDLIVGFGRPMMVARYFAVLVVGSFCFDLYQRFGESVTVSRVMVVVLTVLVLLSVLGAHHSPMTIRINQQVTDAELDGSGWYLTQGDEAVELTEYGINIYRFEDALRGFRSNNVTEDVDPPPDHFGYDAGETLGAQYGESHYLAITSAGRQFYPEVWPGYRRFWRYTPDEFDRLEDDRTVSQVYANGGFDLYLVEGTNTTAPNETASSSVEPVRTGVPTADAGDPSSKMDGRTLDGDPRVERRQRETVAFAGAPT